MENKNKPRGYNPEKHSTMPYVDKEYRELFNKLAGKSGRYFKKELENIIYEASLKAGV